MLKVSYVRNSIRKHPVFYKENKETLKNFLILALLLPKMQN